MLRRLIFLLVLFSSPGAAMEPLVLQAQLPRETQTAANLSITHVEAVCTLRGALARTTVTLTLAVDGPPGERPPRMEAGLSFYLPPNCAITGAALDIGSLMRRASLTFRETAEAAYAAVVNRQLDPVLITMDPDGRVRIKVFPITPAMPRVLQLEFSQIITPTQEGWRWEFPLRFPQPIPRARLTVDAPGLLEHGSSVSPDFRGGEEWTLPLPDAPAGGLWPAQPDETGIYLVHGLLPPGTPPPSPDHLLLVVETSALHRWHDAAAEHKFLTEFVQRMGKGTITLATYDFLAGATQSFQVQDGQCPALFQALGALSYEGAPRPGQLKLAHIPANLTVILGSLQHPVERQSWPDLPAKAPVLVLDSVSPAPSTLALKLAGRSGGAVYNPRSPQPPVWFPHIPLADSYFSDPTFYLMPDESAWLVTAQLSGVTLGPPDAGKPPFPIKGQDTTAGQLISLHRGRDRLFSHLQDAPGSLRHAQPPEWAASPWLGERTGFIVLEELRQYQQFKIPLPPDLAGTPEAASTSSGRNLPTDSACFSRALSGPANTPSDIREWRMRLSGWKLKAMAQLMKNLTDFQEHRTASRQESRGLEQYVGEELARTSVENLEAATRQLPELAARYGAAGKADRAGLIRQSRTLQQAKITMMEILSPEMWGGMLRSGGYTPPADPFSGPSTFAAAGLARFFGDASAPADPFDGAGMGAGAGVEFDSKDAAPPSAVLVQADPNEQTERDDSTLAQTVAAAVSLHREGKDGEALRTLSNLAAQPQPDHGAIRYLAWQLLEWDEVPTALEVIKKADFLHGPDTTTQRDLALVQKLSAYPYPEAADILASLPLGVAQREAAALNGQSSAALRLVLECAEETADADLEIEGPDFEIASWQNPVPSFGGVLSFDGQGFTPEDFVMVDPPKTSLTVRIRLHGEKPAPLRLTLFRNFGRPDMKSQIVLLPACQPGVTTVLEIPAS